MTATFVPSLAMPYDASITVTLTTGITDLVGNPLSPDKTWSFHTEPVPDTTPPTVLNVYAITPDGTYASGSVMDFIVNFDENITNNGMPQLLLETGVTDQAASMISITGATTTFRVTIQAGGYSTDLDYVSSGSLILNGGSIVDFTGNNAVLTLPIHGAAGSLGANNAIIIDAVLPVASASISTGQLLKSGDICAAGKAFRFRIAKRKWSCQRCSAGFVLRAGMYGFGDLRLLSKPLFDILQICYTIIDGIPKLLYYSNMRAKQIVKILEQNGWSLKRVKGSHHIMAKAGFRSVPVPIHGNKDVDENFIRELEKQTGVKLL